LFYLTISISSDYDIYGICSQFLVLGQAPRYLSKINLTKFRFLFFDIQGVTTGA